MSGLNYDNVLVPVDFSEQSIKAVDTALEITGDAANVHVVHVLEDLTPAHPGELYGSIDTESRARHSTEALNKQFADEKYSGLRIEIVTGAPGAEIPEHAKRVEADLIVMPSHGRSGVARLLIGSVAERVIRHAPCAVLILR